MNYTYEQLEQLAQPGAFSQFDIEILAQELAKLTNGIYLEIGVWKGRSLSVVNMLIENKDIKLYGIDLLKYSELERYIQYNPRITFYWGDSVFVSTVWQYLVGANINILLIDGDHTYEGCKRDIDAWFPHMTKEGVMLFHDYDESSPGVIQAVDEFSSLNNLNIEIYKTKDKNTSMAKIQL